MPRTYHKEDSTGNSNWENKIRKVEGKGKDIGTDKRVKTEKDPCKDKE